MGEKTTFPLLTGILQGAKQGDCGSAGVRTRPAATNLILWVSFSPISYSHLYHNPQESPVPGSGAAGGLCTPTKGPGPRTQDSEALRPLGPARGDRCGSVDGGRMGCGSFSPVEAAWEEEGQLRRLVSPKGGIAVGKGRCHNTPCPEAELKVSPQIGWIRASPVSFPRCETSQGARAARPGTPAPQHEAHLGQKPLLRPVTSKGRDHRITPRDPNLSSALLTPGCSTATSPWEAALCKAPKWGPRGHWRSLSIPRALILIFILTWWCWLPQLRQQHTGEKTRWSPPALHHPPRRDATSLACGDKGISWQHGLAGRRDGGFSH